MKCEHCDMEVTRYITKGPYCSLHCRDLHEDEAEIAQLALDNLKLRAVLEGLEFENLDDLMKRDIAFCFDLGVKMKNMIEAYRDIAIKS